MYKISPELQHLIEKNKLLGNKKLVDELTYLLNAEADNREHLNYLCMAATVDAASLRRSYYQSKQMVKPENLGPYIRNLEHEYRKLTDNRYAWVSTPFPDNILKINPNGDI